MTRAELARWYESLEHHRSNDPMWFVFADALAELGHHRLARRLARYTTRVNRLEHYDRSRHHVRFAGSLGDEFRPLHEAIARALEARPWRWP